MTNNEQELVEIIEDLCEYLADGAGNSDIDAINDALEVVARVTGDKNTRFQKQWRKLAYKKY